MPDPVTLTVNGATVSVPSGTSVAVAVMLAGATCRTSISGQPRGPLCGMGVCYECRVAINGRQHWRSCLTLCETGMEVRTNE